MLPTSKHQRIRGVRIASLLTAVAQSYGDQRLWARLCGAGVFLVSVLYVVFLFPSAEFPWLNKDDASQFLTLAINIAEYGRYSIDSVVGAEYRLHATWPPVFPLYLAAVIGLFGYSWIAIKLAMVVAGIATLAVLWRLLGSQPEGKLAVLLTALSPYFFLFSHHSMAEVPYMLLVFAALTALNTSQRASGFAIAGVLAAAAFLTRGYAAVLFPVGLFFIFFFKKELSRRERIVHCLCYGAAPAAAIIGWAVYTRHAFSAGLVDEFSMTYGSGTQLLSGLFRSPIDYAKRFYWSESRYVTFLILPISEPLRDKSQWWSFAVALPLIFLIFTGWMRSWRNHACLTLWFTANVLMLAAPSPSLRYWVPAMPILLFYLLIGARFLLTMHWRNRMAWLFFAGCLLLVSLSSFVQHLTSPDHLRFYDKYGKNSRDIMVWASKSLP